jgi:hypothetical protein
MQKADGRKAGWSIFRSRVPLMPGGLLLLSGGIIFLNGCDSRPEPPAVSPSPTLSLQATYDAVATNLHRAAADARGAERERLLTQAAAGYEEVLRQFPSDTNVCLLSTRALANVRALQGRLDESVRLHLSVTNSPAAGDMDRLMALKSAGDLLWEAGRPKDAKPLYEQVVERFGKPGSSQLNQLIVRGARSRLEAMKVQENP